MQKKVTFIVFSFLTIFVFSQNEKRGFEKYNGKIVSRKFKEASFYEADSVRLILRKDLVKNYGEIFSKGLIIAKWFIDLTGKNEFCAYISNKEAKEMDMQVFKPIENFKGRYVYVYKIVELPHTLLNYNLQIWSNYCAYVHQDYVFEASFDKNPLKDNDAKLISLKFTYKPL